MAEDMHAVFSDPQQLGGGHELVRPHIALPIEVAFSDYQPMAAAMVCIRWDRCVASHALPMHAQACHHSCPRHWAQHMHAPVEQHSRNSSHPRRCRSAIEGVKNMVSSSGCAITSSTRVLVVASWRKGTAAAPGSCRCCCRCCSDRPLRCRRWARLISRFCGCVVNRIGLCETIECLAFDGLRQTVLITRRWISNAIVRCGP